MSSLVKNKQEDPNAILVGVIEGKKEKEKVYVSLKPKEELNKSSIGKTFTKNGLEFIPYLNRNANQRSAIFISGISGSGKSTLTRDLIRNLRKYAVSYTHLTLPTIYSV